MKVCRNPRCPLAGQPQEDAAFYRHPTTADGLTSWCRVCTKESARRSRTRLRPFGPVARRQPPRSDDQTPQNGRWLAVLKSVAWCAACHEREPSRLLFVPRDDETAAFDLNDPREHREKSLAEVRDEVLKHDVLCAECRDKRRLGRLRAYEKRKTYRKTPMIARIREADAVFAGREYLRRRQTGQTDAETPE